VHIDPSELLPLHATASGLAYLAFSDADVVEHALAEAMKQFTDRTTTDPARIRAALPAIRARGYAIADQTFEREVVGIAAPVFNRSGDVCGAVAVAAPTSRMTAEHEARFAAAAREAALEVTQAWGGRPPRALLETAV
jgi:DNA-binding IclR family transcriptional regulator